jgi:hypothetical protein
MAVQRHTRAAIAMCRYSGADDAGLGIVPKTGISSCWRLRCGVHGVFPKPDIGFPFACATGA